MIDFLKAHPEIVAYMHSQTRLESAEVQALKFTWGSMYARMIHFPFLADTLTPALLDVYLLTRNLSENGM